MWPSFYDIPVYRLTEKQYEARQANHVNKEISNEKQSYFIGKMYVEDPSQEEQRRTHLRRRYGGPWDFNEIIGWIRLYFYGDQVRGEWWKIDKSTKHKSRHKQFEYREYKFVYEELMDRNITSRKIYRHILNYLARAKADPRVRKHFVDTSVFERIGPHVNWKALRKATNCFSQRS
jgi:hypothetical protein